MLKFPLTETDLDPEVHIRAKPEQLFSHTTSMICSIVGFAEWYKIYTSDNVYMVFLVCKISSNLVKYILKSFEAAFSVQILSLKHSVLCPAPA